MNQREAVIVSYGRSPCCRARKGGLAQTHPIDYAAQVLQGVLNKIPSFPAELIDDVIVGCAMPVNQMDYNAGRLVARRAGLPNSIPGQTINRFCSSSLQAIATAAGAILSNQMDCVVAGGIESMSMCFAPYPQEFQNTWLNEHDIGTYMPMGETAERVADRYHITREEMDQMAVESHKKAHEAQISEKLSGSIIPVYNKDGVLLTSDEGVRPGTTMETLSSLNPCFRENGRVTAASSSQTTDAAAFVVVMDATLAKKYGITPIARFVGFSVAGCEAEVMGLGPIYAVPKVLNRTNLELDDIDVIELNEAFASQALACIKTLGLPAEKVNPYGGAMALGHPMGATGAFLTGKVLDYLQEEHGRYGMVTMCVGGGMGAAAIFERL